MQCFKSFISIQRQSMRDPSAVKEPYSHGSTSDRNTDTLSPTDRVVHPDRVPSHPAGKSPIRPAPDVSHCQLGGAADRVQVINARVRRRRLA